MKVLGHRTPRRTSWIHVVASAQLAAALLSPAAAAHVWHVGGSNPDFSDIPAAITAASDGDVILVRPGTYSAFTLDKGVQIRASSTPFKISTAKVVVTIENIGTGKRAGVAGMLMPTSFIGTDWLLDVHDCSGELILEDITIEGFGVAGAAHNLRLDIADCENVVITDLAAIDGLEPSYGAAGPTVTIARSSVRMSGVRVTGATGLPGNVATGPEDGGSGEGGILATDSFLVLAAPSIKGGNGGDGAIYLDPFGGTHYGDGGFGGDAVHLVNSEAVILGGASHFLTGGDGGDGACQFGTCGVGGDGGDALWVEGGSAEVSLVTTTGGSGGANGGSAGLDLHGNGSRNDVLAWLTTSGDLAPGAAFSLEVRATQPSLVLLIASDRGGFVDVRHFGGPPLSVFPGTYYYLLNLGVTDASGYLTLTASLPNDPALGGFLLEVQAAVFDSTAESLTNAAARVVGE